MVGYECEHNVHITANFIFQHDNPEVGKLLGIWQE